jgi:hypothetical protein
MATLYLDRKGAALDIDAGTLTVRLGGELATRIPLAPLDRVVLRGDAVLSTRVLTELWRHDIGLLLLSGRHGEATARLVGRPHDDVALRLAQYRRASDAEACRETARHIVGGKLAAEGRLLARALETRPDRRKPLTDAIATVARVQARVADDGEPLDRDTLTGLEGAGAAAYFRAYATLFPESLEFARRRRRPPPDPVNVCLSLGYILLHHEAVREVQIVGLPGGDTPGARSAMRRLDGYLYAHLCELFLCELFGRAGVPLEYRGGRGSPLDLRPAFRSALRWYLWLPLRRWLELRQGDPTPRRGTTAARRRAAAQYEAAAPQIASRFRRLLGSLDRLLREEVP